MKQENIADDPVAGAQQPAIATAEDVIARFQLSDLKPLLRAVQAQRKKQDLNVAVLGRFKAGKSSFLNDIVDRLLLPVGVLPVTAVVTEIAYGQHEYAELVAMDGQIQRISLDAIADYITEAANPQNVKQIDVVRVFLPSLQRFRGIRFVDTPGLESIFEHNTETALSWSPNVDLAVVTIAVDPPLTQQDLTLIERLHQYTPNVTILLTKVDLLSPSERDEVEQFVRTQLEAKFHAVIPLFPYSIKSGYELLRTRFEEQQILRPLSSAHEQHQAILVRKLTTLLRSIEDYLRLSLKAAEAAESQREELRSQILGSEEFLRDQKLQLQLLAKHTAGKVRNAIDSYLQQNVRRELEETFKERLRSELPGWRGGFAKILASFEHWLRQELDHKLTALSNSRQSAFCAPLHELEGQCQRNLQSFRDQLSEKVMRLFGIPLRTTETEIEIQPPRSPDISVGKVFDHNWELISILIPMPLIRWAVERRFVDRVEREVYKNLSRLTTQWEERVHAAILKASKEAEHRFDELVATVTQLLAKKDENAQSRIISHLDQIQDLLKQLV